MKRITSTLFLLSAVLLHGCSKGSDTEQKTHNASSLNELPTITEVKIPSAKALSQHYVAVEFSQAVTAEQLADAQVHIVSGAGQELATNNITLTNNGLGAIIATDAQDPVTYNLMLTSKAVNPTASGTSKFDKPSAPVAATSSHPLFTFAAAADFIGSTGPEPIVLSVTALSNTQVLVTFDRDMDKTFSDQISAYRIVAPDENAGNEDEGRLLVTASVTDTKDPRRITLTTTPQNDVPYTLLISNIITKPGAFLVHPDRNGGPFFGIAATDTTKPRLMSAASTSHTQVLASFSEPLWNNAAEPTHYQLCNVAFTSAGTCPPANQLAVTQSELIGSNTQVLLTTAPQVSGLSYYLSVTGVTDRATPAPGNAIEVPTIAQLTGSGSGAPRIASTLATDNTHLLVTFTERMAADALNKNNYRIENPPLDIINAVQGSDAWHVILTTTPQERRDYQLTAADIHSAEGTLITAAVPPATFVGIASKDTQKPTLIAAVAETSSRTRLYFSEPVDSSAATPTFYRITYCPEFQTCTPATLRQLPILSVQLVESNTQAILTTPDLAPRVEHQIVVSENVTDQALPLPHNAIDASFAMGTFGLFLSDKTAPSLAGMTITSANTITLSFSEVVDTNAANPLFYVLCSQTFASDGSCPSELKVPVFAATLNPSNTQATLTTAPLTAGQTYFVRVNNSVVDTSGNAIASNGNSANVNYAGTTSVANPNTLPQVVGAISTSNTSVTVSFSAIMGESALLPANYLFTQENVNGEAGTVYTLAVSWIDSSHTSVSITTTSQNEVTYRLTAVNVKDQTGNPLDTRKLVLGSSFNPSSATFAGSPPVAQIYALNAGNWQWLDANDDGKKSVGDAVTINGISVVLTDKNLDGKVDNWQDANQNGLIDDGDSLTGSIDSDGDGLADNEELRAVVISITGANGKITEREVTSDPTQIDTDKDGLTDLEEWSFGTDPRSADTDADGLSDYIERKIVFSSPIDQDTDGDTLTDGLEHNFFHSSPILADTDGDQFDDAKELLSLNRDPKVADLPEIAIHVGEVNLQLDERFTYVDSKGETQTSESSTNTALSSTENTSFANSVSTMDENRFGFEWGFGYGIRDAQTDFTSVNDASSNHFISKAPGALFDRLFFEANAGGNFERTTGTTIQVDNASARESQQTLENAIARATEHSQGSEVTRELVGAKISANISVENTGNVALKVTNLQISVEQIDPQNPSKLLPIATLVAESGQLTGSDVEINLGPFDKNKGPFIFSNATVYPTVVEALMRNPKSLVFKVVNYDIADEYDRNFAFASQLARDRTAGITFDFGELGTQAYYVATSGVLDGGKYLGGINATTGKPQGLALGYLLENVLGIPKHQSTDDFIDAGVDGELLSIAAGDDVKDTTAKTISAGPNGVLESIPAGDDRLRNRNIKTGLIAGADKRVDSIAQGDDVQLVPFGSTGVAPKTLVIDPGSNGILESGRSGDDGQEFISGYQVQTTCSIESSAKALIGTFCSVSANGCSCNGPKGLVRVNTLRNGDYRNTWFARFSGDIPAAVDFDQIQLKPGQDIRLAFLQDLDKDGLFAHEEFLFGSTDSSVNRYDNSLFGPVVEQQHYRSKTLAELNATAATPDNFADSMDSDRDGISDLAEAKLGWLISRNGELKRVFSSPALADSDNDGLWDIQEQDLREFCTSTDPRQDALCAFKNEPVAKADATGIIVGANGRLDTLKAADDEYALFIPKNTDNNNTPDTDDTVNRGLMFATVAILPGPNGIIDTNIQPGDEYTNAKVNLPATDPLQSDTDQDRVSDGDELFGYAVGMSIVEGTETECSKLAIGNCNPELPTWGIADTRAQGDDVQRIYPGSRTKQGDVIVSAGANGILETLPAGNDSNVAQFFYAAGADRISNCVPTASPTNREVFGRTSNVKLDPYAPAIWGVNGSNPVVSNSTCAVDDSSQQTANKDIKLYGRVVVTDPLRRDTDNDRIPDGFEIAIGADPTVEDGDNFRDSDFDGLSDAQETEGWVVAINNSLGKLMRSSAINADSDYDGLPDYVERDIGTNPNVADTDGDGLDDYAEFRSVMRTQNGQAHRFSVADYTYLPSVFSGFSLVVNPTAYNTDPALADSDNDGLSDYQELITGYQINVTGQAFKGPVILTNPNKADTDGDGLADGNEFNGVEGANGVVYVTNAASVDTDGDGSADNVELASDSLTDPLVPDLLVHVTYESLYLANLNDCQYGTAGTGSETTNGTPSTDCPQNTHVLWWLYASGNDGLFTGKHLLSSSDEFAYVPDGSVKPLGAGHSSLIDPAMALAGLSTDDSPSANTYDSGLKQTGKACEPAGSSLDENDCSISIDINRGDKGYSPNANINFRGEGITGAHDFFIVTWVGEIYISSTADYEFKVKADDGVRIFIDNSTTSILLLQDGELANDTDIWHKQNTLNASGTAPNLTAGWHPIKITYFDWTEEADIKVEWRKVNATTPEAFVVLATSSLRHKLGNGAYSCVALERKTDQSSYISLNRLVDINNSQAPAKNLSPLDPYYGSTLGSELNIFKSVMDEDPDGKRYYVQTTPLVMHLNGQQVSTKERIDAIIDLAASRNVVENLVRSDADFQSTRASAALKTASDGRKYYALSEDGQKLYRQLTDASGRFGEQTFVLHENETLQLSGTLMKIDDLSLLTSCPIGASGVVSQFGSSCSKRFSRSLSYSDIKQQRQLEFSLTDMNTQTYSTGVSTGCDMDLTTSVRAR